MSNQHNMKVLVAIANYGTKNMKYLDTLIREYRTMPYGVQIVVLSNIPKELGPDIEVRVGLPSKNPWSLPFAHKKLFAERMNDYDLFIYSEDDTLVTERNMRAFMEATGILPKTEIAGFMRYEVDQNGNKFISTVHSHYHWVPDSYRENNGYAFAKFTNDHSGCYLITREQLKKAISSNGFLVDPHQEKYDLLVSAATDPYTKCGFTKVICISHMEDFLLHHLPNHYIGRMGLEEKEFEKQLKALHHIHLNGRPKERLFHTETLMRQGRWSKSYYEEYREEIIDLIPNNAKKILSVGCGSGAVEGKLVSRGKRVMAIPLDMVIASCAEAKGVEILPPSFEKAFEIIKSDRFDCILILEVLQHLADPIALLCECSKLLGNGAKLILSVPNFNHIKVWKDLFSGEITAKQRKYFKISNLQFTAEKMVKKWLKKIGMERIEVKYGFEERYRRASNFAVGKLNGLLASTLFFTGE
jgi:2-polyprenyl-3-methyl-5-hydroxy-6-metoxy-1,4-benzoquinol methylase